jgi:hypothetical protein
LTLLVFIFWFLKHRNCFDPCRYEESQLHESIYQLRVRLLGTDGQTVISEYIMSPTEELSEYSHNWKEVGPRHVLL